MATQILNDVWMIGATWWQGCRELLLRDNCFCNAMAVSQVFNLISSDIAYCISPYASFYAGLSCCNTDWGGINLWWWRYPLLHLHQLHDNNNLYEWLSNISYYVEHDYWFQNEIVSTKGGAAWSPRLRSVQRLFIAGTYWMEQYSTTSVKVVFQYSAIRNNCKNSNIPKFHL